MNDATHRLMRETAALLKLEFGFHGWYQGSELVGTATLFACVCLTSRVKWRHWRGFEKVFESLLIRNLHVKAKHISL
jgi:hypothetical protein